jgi:hypothetical protein
VTFFDAIFTPYLAVYVIITFALYDFTTTVKALVNHTRFGGIGATGVAWC